MGSAVRPIARRIILGVAVAGLVAACGTAIPNTPTVSPTAPTGSSGATAPVSVSAAAAPSASIRHLTLGDAASCPVTKPVQDPASIGDALFGSAAAFGNADLWVGGLGDGGVMVADRRMLEPDGSIGWKLGWYRLTTGTLTISGHRLDASAPPPIGDVPDGYGDHGFQASGVYFPTEGCWQITGIVGRASLTFVTFVLITR